MRLWHEDLISKLPRQQLLGQHREICALRGNGWGKPHATVNYVFKYSPAMLYFYHELVMCEMMHRGYKVEPKWNIATYRGKECEPYKTDKDLWINDIENLNSDIIYPEHNNEYLQECLNNLKDKGIEIKIA